MILDKILIFMKILNRFIMNKAIILIRNENILNSLQKKIISEAKHEFLSKQQV